MPDPIRALVDEELSPAMTKELWSGDYSKVLPVTLQEYELQAVLPAMFYMFRFGVRRGRGQFLAKFADATGSEAPASTFRHGHPGGGALGSFGCLDWVRRRLRACDSG